MTCSRCGYNELATSAFCSNCGMQLNVPKNNSQFMKPNSGNNNVQENVPSNRQMPPNPIAGQSNTQNSKNAKFTYVGSTYSSQNPNVQNQGNHRGQNVHGNNHTTQIRSKKSNGLRNILIVFIFLALVFLAVFLVVQNRNRQARERETNFDSFIEDFNNSIEDAFNNPFDDSNEDSESTERENTDSDTDSSTEDDTDANTDIDLNIDESVEDELIRQTFENLENGLNNGDGAAIENSISPGFFSNIPMFGDLFGNLDNSDNSNDEDNSNTTNNSMFQFEIIDIEYTSNTTARAKVSVTMNLSILDPIQTENEIDLEKIDGRWVIDLGDIDGLDLDLDIPDDLFE